MRWIKKVKSPQLVQSMKKVAKPLPYPLVGSFLRTSRFTACFVLCCLLFTACKEAVPRQYAPIKVQGTTVVLLDSIEASKVIARDEAEHFFEQVSTLDMLIQMKGTSISTNIIADYQSFLKKEVASFDEREQLLLRKVFVEVERLLRPLNLDLLPDSLYLIKSKGEQYGTGTYYTRAQSIVIPQPELDERSVESLTQVMLHEFFHIYSRYNAQKRAQLYQLIGFEKLTLPVKVPDSLKQQILLNPDGINWRYGIRFSISETESVLAVPIIMSPYPTYQPELKEYFEHLSFQLYPVTQKDGIYEVEVKQGFHSPLPAVDSLPGFFAIIGDNTNYIIHPDEILADNFVLLLLSKTGKAPYQISQYSARGQEILLGMERILTE